MENKRRIITAIILSIFLIFLVIPLASAEIILNSQPKSVYNLGEVITIPITIKPLTEIKGIFEMNLVCPDQEINYYKNGIFLSLGEEKRLEPSLILTRYLLGTAKGNCVIKAKLGEDYVLTNEFKISDSINVEPNIEKSEINPGDKIIIKGFSTKESGINVDGFIDIKIFHGESLDMGSLYQTIGETINSGLFYIEIPTYKDMPFGSYVILLEAYEKDLLGERTNQGTYLLSFLVKQIPTNLEISIENKEVEPGTSLKGKIILHDQTGENINALATINIKNQKDKLLEKISINTGETFEIPTNYNENPGEFKILVESIGIDAESSFIIKEKEDIQLNIIEKTLILKNIGNVPYCEKTILVKIGNEALNIDVCLKVNEEKKYILNAPDGDYDIEIISEEEKITDKISLTGKAIDVKEVKTPLPGYTFLWIFLIGVLGFVVFLVYKKNYKKSFVGYSSKKSLQSSLEPEAKIKGPLFSTRNKADLSLSIKGDKHNVSVVCLKIKNFNEVISNKKSVEEVLKKISQLSDDFKATIYEGDGNIFFIFTPLITRTFKNEETALLMAQKIKEILNYYNKILKQKIEYGISINYGVIVANQTPKGLEFVSYGDLMTKSKKIASISNELILLSEDIKNKIGPLVKTEKLSSENVNAFMITEIRNKDVNEKFISRFLERNK